MSGAIETVEVGGGVRLAVADAGAGPAVILLHGWPVTSSHWRLAVPALTAAGFRAICADLRGQSASVGPGTFAKEELARDVVALAERLGLNRFALAGHDWGGTVAYLVAADHDERVAALVVEEELLPGCRESVPEPGRAHYPDWHGPLLRAPGLAEALVTGREEAFHRAFLRQSAGPMGLPAEAERAYLDAYRGPAALAASLGYYRTATQDAEDIAARADPPLRVPVLTIGGEYAMGTAVKWCLAARAVDVRHLEVPGAGHYPAEQRPDLVAPALVAFLSEHLR